MAVRPAIPRLSARGAIFVVGLLAIAVSARADGVRIEPVRDNTLFADADGDTSNGSGPALFAGNNAQGLARRALIQFDVAAHVPAGARIDSVVLTLHVSNSPNLLPRTFTVHRVREAWGEGASAAAGGTGAPAMSGDATWTCAFFPGRLWSAPGGDFDPDPSGWLVVGGPDRYDTATPGMTDDVRAWLARPESNFGWLVRGEESSTSTARRFDSRECDREEQRPSLTVYYTPGPGPPPMSWSGLRTRYR